MDDPPDTGLRWQPVIQAKPDAVMTRMVTVPGGASIVPVAIDIPLVFLAPSSRVTVISVAIVVLSIPFMLLVMPRFVVVPIMTAVTVMSLQELFLVAWSQ